MGKYQSYEKYKDSGVKWLGEIPQHWQQKRFKFYVNLINNKIEAENSNLPYMGLEHIESWTGKRIEDENASSEGIGSHFLANDILFGKLRPYLAKVYLSEIEGLASTEALVFRCKNNIFPKFLKYYVLSRDFINIVDSSTFGAKMPRASWDFIGNLFFTLPTLDEQETIAQFLDHKTQQIDDLIAKKKALIEKLDEKRTALISHAVTKGLDPSVPMKDSGIEWLGQIPEHWSLILLRLRYLIELGKMLDQRRISGDYLVKYLRNIDVQWDFINQNDLPEMDINPNEYERYLVTDGDLLVCEGGESGRSAIVRGVNSILGFQKAIHRLRVIGTEEIHRFLFYTFYYLVKLGVFVAEGNPNTINHLTVEKLKLYRLPRPPQKEQQAIVTYLDHKTAEIDQQKAKIKEAIELLKEYRTALITNAVTGKIDVRQVPIP